LKYALVTGADGFVGRHMTRHLMDLGWTVMGIDLRRGGDVMKHMWHLTKRYDLVVHAAAQSPHRAAIDTQLAAFPYNVALDSVMMNWAMTTKQHRFVYLSSCAAYPACMQTIPRFGADARFEETDVNTHSGIEEPFDVYGWTKLFGERMAMQMREAGVATFIVRPFSGYGEDQSTDFPMRAFAQRAKAREDPFVIWGNAYQVRDWIHINDIVRAIMAIVDANEQSPVNLCTGQGTTMSDVAQLLIDRVDRDKYRPKIIVDDSAPMGAFYRVGDPALLHTIYTPEVNIEEGTWRMMQ
jgi:nucleoside-diphosphate-sugar epimerase